MYSAYKYSAYCTLHNILFKPKNNNNNNGEGGAIMFLPIFIDEETSSTGQ